MLLDTLNRPLRDLRISVTDAVKDCAFDPQNISVVECGGKFAMHRLFRIFNELHRGHVSIRYKFGSEAHPDMSIRDLSGEIFLPSPGFNR